MHGDLLISTQWELKPWEQMRSSKKSVYILQNDKTKQAEGFRKASTQKRITKKEKWSKTYEQSQTQGIVSGAKDCKTLKKRRGNHVNHWGEVMIIKKPVRSIIIQFHDQLTNVFTKITKLKLLMKKKNKDGRACIKLPFFSFQLKAPSCVQIRDFIDSQQKGFKNSMLINFSLIFLHNIHLLINLY